MHEAARLLSPVRAAVLGRPVAHSLSPVLHRAAYAALGIDGTYEALDCGVDELGDVLAARANWTGFSCTMPLKRAALAIAAEVTDTARAVGAANTLLPGASGWLADNTDVAGILGALAEVGAAPGSATILGAGGTAQAALVALARMGLTQVEVLVRSAPRASALAAIASSLNLDLTVSTFDDVPGGFASDLVVSTVPAGAADAFNSLTWRRGQVLLDVVYDPWPTVLATAAGEGGATVVSGALMLLHQAAEQVRAMLGCDPPTEAMRAALAGAAPGSGL